MVAILAFVEAGQELVGLSHMSELIILLCICQAEEFIKEHNCNDEVISFFDSDPTGIKPGVKPPTGTKPQNPGY